MANPFADLPTGTYVRNNAGKDPVKLFRQAIQNMVQKRSVTWVVRISIDHVPQKLHHHLVQRGYTLTQWSQHETVLAVDLTRDETAIPIAPPLPAAAKPVAPPPYTPPTSK